MCDEVATSFEHVPPKCIFPKMKDLGLDVRQNLITVPSCDIHNGMKSKDDEFLMVSLAGILGNNSIGYEYYNGKIQRSLRRSSYRLLNKVFLKSRYMRVDGENEFIDLLIGTPDYPRLLKCFEHIAFGIYRNHFGQKYVGGARAFIDFIYYEGNNETSFKELIRHKAEKELRGVAKNGDNEAVFYYQMTDLDDLGIRMIKLCFYENVNIYIALVPACLKLENNLAMMFIKGGMNTVVNEDEKQFEFNKK